MKILQIIQRPQLRGAEMFSCQLSKRLLALGHSVDMMVLFGDESQKLPFDLPFYYLNADERKRWRDIDAYKRLSNFIKRNGYDIVQANAGDTLKYAALSRKLFDWKAKLVFRNANMISGFLNARWKVLLNRWLMSEVDFVASVSKECHRDFVQTFQWPDDKISTLPIGVDSAVKANVNPLDEQGFSGRFPVLLSVAGFVPEKNHAGLIRIVDAIRQSFPETLLVMIGEGKLKPEIESLCRQKGMEHHVWFTGKRSDVPAFMQHAYALLMPSLIEGLPGVILEAFANKLPVVATNVGGIKEIVLNNESGWLVDSRNEESFTKAVTDMLSIDVTEMDRVLQNALSMVSTNYSNDTIARNFEKLYVKLLERSN